MRIDYLALLCAVALLVGGGCRDKAPVPVDVPLPQGLKDLALFRDGTYWVYRNAQTGELDSAYVTGFRLFTLDVTLGKLPKDPVVARHETFEYDVRSTRTGQRLQYVSAVNCIAAAYDPNGLFHKVLRLPVGPAGTGGDGIAHFLFYQPVVGTARQSNGFSTSTVVAVHDTLTVGGVLYRRVVQVDTDRNYSELPSEAPSRHFIAPGAGLVRREVQVNGRFVRWDVVRKRIVQ